MKFTFNQIFFEKVRLHRKICPTDFTNIFIQNQERSFLWLFLTRDDELSSFFASQVNLLDEYVRLQNLIENSSNDRVTWIILFVGEKMLSIRVRSKIFQDHWRTYHWYDHSRNNTNNEDKVTLIESCEVQWGRENERCKDIHSDSKK